MYTDGASRGNPGVAAVAYAIFDSTGNLLEKNSKIIGIHTNNEAEYEAMLWGLEMIMERRCDSAIVFSDSELMVKQINGEYRVLDEKLRKCATKVAVSKKLFESFELRHVKRENPRIQLVDGLANEALDRQ